MPGLAHRDSQHVFIGPVGHLGKGRSPSRTQALHDTLPSLRLVSVCEPHASLGEIIILIFKFRAFESLVQGQKAGHSQAGVGLRSV